MKMVIPMVIMVVVVLVLTNGVLGTDTGSIMNFGDTFNSNIESEISSFAMGFIEEKANEVLNNFWEISGINKIM
ncbi:hypothetical protein [Virgibacillus sp. DJP39]|uniref:hypothetical protein n=1 Tax=Virgibacillus sp. DJP39 TaxID=3409790 RepID=UPI003BB5CD9D